MKLLVGRKSKLRGWHGAIRLENRFVHEMWQTWEPPRSVLYIRLRSVEFPGGREERIEHEWLDSK